MKPQSRSNAPSEREFDAALMSEKLKHFLSQFTSSMPKGERRLSVFAIQLREPDYWIVFAGFERSGSAQFQILFDGPWKKAVDYLSERASSLPKPEFIPFPVAGDEIGFASLCQSALNEALVKLPKALLSGDSSLSIYTAGIFVLKHGGVLTHTSNFYFETWFDESRRLKTGAKNPLFAPGRERKAFFCRFPIPVGRKGSGLAFKTKLYRDLAHDKELFQQRGKVRAVLFSDRVTILLFPNGLLVADERHLPIAVDALGALLAYSFFRGAACAPASIQDIGWIEINADGGIGSSSGDLAPLRRTALSSETISTAKLNAIFRGFIRGVDSELLSDLRLLHRAVFHFVAGEYLQSFTLAWTVLERRITRLWKFRMAEKRYSGKRLDELCDSERYTTSVIIDMLEVAKALTAEQARRMHSLRKSRNKAMHEGRTPQMETALDCLGLAIEFTAKNWKDMQFSLDTLEATAPRPD